MSSARSGSMIAGAFLVVAGVAWWAARSPEPEAIVVPNGEAVAPARGGSSWTPEMQRVAEEMAHEAKAAGEARRAEIERLRAAGKIRWHSPAGDGPQSPHAFYWVWVETGEPLYSEDNRPRLE